jgi:hypothetical protein
LELRSPDRVTNRPSGFDRLRLGFTRYLTGIVPIGMKKERQKFAIPNIAKACLS